MKFKIRDGFFAHVTSRAVDGAEERHMHRGGSFIELDSKAALARLHQLEPADAEAAAFLQQHVARVRGV